MKTQRLLLVLTVINLGLLVFLFAVFAYALAAHLQVMDRWLERPYLLVFPIIAAAAAWPTLTPSSLACPSGMETSDAACMAAWAFLCVAAESSSVVDAVCSTEVACPLAL